MQGTAVTTVGLSLLQFLTTTEAKTLWSSVPATSGTGDAYILKTGYPVGNGRLGGVQFGNPGQERVLINIDSLWVGGPFESSNYTGGNPTSNNSGVLPAVRSQIFSTGTGDASPLVASGKDNFGTYRVMGNLAINIAHGANISSYKRSLDIAAGVHTTTYQASGANFTTTLFCSNPANVCVYRVASTVDLPQITLQFENAADTSHANATCAAGYARYTGITQNGPPEGIKYDAIARVVGAAATQCGSNGTLTVPASSGVNTLTLVFSADTNYDATKGNPANNYSFKGTDPGPRLESLTAKAAATGFDKLYSDHTADFQALTGAFALDLPDPNNSAQEETVTIISRYTGSGSGDPWLEGLMFDYSRYLLISSSRANSLPANLQGRWADKMEEPWDWGSDYHVNINLQMNYWAAAQTGLEDTTAALWNFIINTWVPRGTEAAANIYGAPGWTMHHMMNIFGHTGLLNSVEGDYAVAPAWMMQHVWDNFEYYRDLDWLRNVAYPLIKGVAQFWLSQLQDDAYTKDGSLVTNPCYSPEHPPTTFGCPHWQQLIHQVFEATLNSIGYIGESDTQFKNQIVQALEKLDKGMHVASWGGLKEWKLPESAGYDVQSTHRHLSHLVGWYPGYSLSSFMGGYNNATVNNAIKRTLESRGNGVDDQSTGWGKAWRAACWARLNDTRAYSELQLLIRENFAANGFDMYQGHNTPFQIDANFGLGGAVLSMLVVDLPQTYSREAEKRTVVLGPAIPPSWGGGSVRNLRLRGGRTVNFSWDSNGLVRSATLHGDGKDVYLVDVNGTDLSAASFPVIQGEAHTFNNGTRKEVTRDTGGGYDVGYIHKDNWLGYSPIDFGSTGATQFVARLASGAANGISGDVHVVLDSPTSTPIGSIHISNTGGWQTWTTRSANISLVTGTHSIYLVFASDQDSDFVNVNWFTFST